MDKVLIVGASGFLGKHLSNAFSDLGSDVMGTSQKYDMPGYIQFSLGTDPVEKLVPYISKADIVILAAAITDISYIDRNPNESSKVNVLASRDLVKEVVKLGKRIIFISSDNVFTGDSGRYSDSDTPVPVSLYGQQKLTIEQEIISLSNNYAIVRLAKLIGFDKTDGSVLNDIAAQLTHSQEVNAASDLIFNPTSVLDAAKAICQLSRSEKSGVFNFCNPEIWNRYALTISMAESMPSDKKINKISFSDLKIKGKRPLNTTMYNSRFFDTFTFSSVKECVCKVAAHWSEGK